uniref:CDP-glucose 4,6-dehydratase n=1 Tax=candidate division WOR-3 bacterium TaxID=2052148 RepID=A0A7V3VUD0_UNCW3
MWDKIAYKVNSDPSSPHEAFFLKLDCSKARALLSWSPVWDINKTIYITTRWYKEFYENGKIMSELDLTEYLIDAKKQKVVWMV